MSKLDSVLVQKIKDKIELLKKLKEKNIKKNFDTVYKDGYFSGGIDCLEELLETVLEELNNSIPKKLVEEKYNFYNEKVKRLRQNNIEYNDATKYDYLIVGKKDAYKELLEGK